MHNIGKNMLLLGTKIINFRERIRIRIISYEMAGYFQRIWPNYFIFIHVPDIDNTMLDFSSKE